jgi:hypothetical protein
VLAVISAGCVSGRYVVKSRTLLKEELVSSRPELKVVADPTTEYSFVVTAARADSMRRSWRLYEVFDLTEPSEKHLFRPRPRERETTETTFERHAVPVSMRLMPSGVSLPCGIGLSQTTTLDLTLVADRLVDTADNRLVFSTESAQCTLAVSRGLATASKQRLEARRRQERRATLMQDSTCLLHAYPNVIGLPEEYEAARIVNGYPPYITGIIQGDIWETYPDLGGEFGRYSTPLQVQTFLASPEHDSLQREVARMRGELVGQTLAAYCKGGISDFDVRDSSFVIELEVVRSGLSDREGALYDAKHVLTPAGLPIWFDQLPNFSIREEKDMDLNWNPGRRFYPSVKVKVTDLDLALRIEKDARYLSDLLVVFRPTGQVRPAGRHSKVVVAEDIALVLMVMNNRPWKRDGYQALVIR